MKRPAWMVGAFGLILWPLLAGADVILRTDWPQETRQPLLEPSPLSPERQRHYDALRLFTKARCLETERRLVEALQTYEEALKLEPEALPVLRALIPLCFKLDRDTKAMEYSRRALTLDPEDVDLAARFCAALREQGDKREATTVLARALEGKSAKERPALHAQLLFELAALQEEQQLWADAAKSFRAVAEILDKPEALLTDPHAVSRAQIREEAAKTWEKIGEVSLRAGQYDQAIIAYQAAQKRSPSRTARLDAQMADVYLAAKKPAQALACLQRYLATQPVGGEAYEKLADILTALGRQREILPTLEQAVERDRFNVALKLVYARQLAAAQRFDDAEKLLKETLARQPTSEVYAELARLLVRLNRADELLARLDADFVDFERIVAARFQLEVISKDRDLVLGLASAACQELGSGEPLDFQTRRVLTVLSRQAGYFELAEYLARSMLADDPQPGEAYLELCRILSEARAHAKLVTVCREAAQQKLKVPADFFQREEARALSLSGEHRAALALTQRLVSEADAGSAEQLHTRFLEVLIHFRAGQFQRAADLGEALLEDIKAPAGQRQTRLLLGGIYATMRQHAKAEHHLETLLAISDDDHHLCNDLGYLWADQGKNLAEAERLIRRAIDLDRAEKHKNRLPLDPPTAGGDNPAYIDSLAWVLFRRGRVEEAAKLLEQALQLEGGSDDPSLWDHLGDVQAALGNLPAATSAWKKARELYQQPRHSAFADKRGEVEAKLKRHEIIRTGGPGRR